MSDTKIGIELSKLINLPDNCISKKNINNRICRLEIKRRNLSILTARKASSNAY